MKTAIIYYPGFLHRCGGAFFHARNLENELRKMGWQVRVITLDDLPIWCRYVPHLLQRTVNYMFVPFGLIYKSLLIKALFKLFYSQNADVLIFEDVYITWESRIPSITVLHSVWSDNWQAYAVRAERGAKFRRREVQIINSLRNPVVTVSFPYKKYLEEGHFAGCLSKTIQVVELGIDQSRFIKMDSDIRNKKSIVYCGALEPRKNVFFLLEVFKRLIAIDPTYKLTIIGDGPDETKLAEFACVQSLPVTFLGRLAYDEVIAELPRHAIYLHTSVKESFSYSLLEAKVAGLWTCAYAELQVPREFIDVGFNEFCAEEWCNGILNIKGDAHAFDRDRYSALTNALSTLKVIEENIKESLR